MFRIIFFFSRWLVAIAYLSSSNLSHFLCWCWDPLALLRVQGLLRIISCVFQLFFLWIWILFRCQIHVLVGVDNLYFFGVFPNAIPDLILKAAVGIGKDKLWLWIWGFLLDYLSRKWGKSGDEMVELVSNCGSVWESSVCEVGERWKRLLEQNVWCGEYSRGSGCKV